MRIRKGDIAEALGISGAAFTRYVKRGCPIDSIEAARAWQAANVRPEQRSTNGTRAAVSDVAAVTNGWPEDEGPADSGPTESYADARARRERAEADLAEREVAVQDGVLCNKAELVAAWVSLVIGARQMLESLPDRITPLVSAETDPSNVRQIIATEIRLACDALADPKATH